MSIGKLKRLIQIAAEDIGLISNLKLTKSNKTTAEKTYNKAQIRAEEFLENTLEHLEETPVNYEE